MLTRRRTALLLLLLGLGTLALGLALPPPAGADCPDTTVVCKCPDSDWECAAKGKRMAGAPLGRCDNGWGTCTASQCSNYLESIKRACQKAGVIRGSAEFWETDQKKDTVYY
jgi:hypothetical protein